MTGWSGHALGVGLVGVVAASAVLAQNPPRFTVSRDVVSVPVSVKERNRPVGDLRADEFRLWDNGVAQQVDSITFDEVPIDVTLFVDNSGSTAQLHGDLNDDLQVLVGLLTPHDRLRLLSFDWSVHDHFGWVSPGERVRVEALRSRRASPVHDAMFTALLHRPEAGRRHLVLALTDGLDNGGLIRSERLVETARRSDAVVHLLMFSPRQDPEENQRRPPSVLVNPLDPRGQDRLRQIARDSGGVAYSGRGNTQQRFTEIIEDFRRSYVLHYSPTGVTRAGWHDLKVEVARDGRFTVRARRGYLVEQVKPEER